MKWHVLHKRHWGENEAQFNIENLHVTWNKGENGPHELTYEISNYYEADLTQIIPYNIDFGLFRNDIEVMQGMVTAVSFESEQEYLSVAAKSYLHYLEKRHFPFDPMRPNDHRVGDPPRGLAYEVANEEVATIIHVLLDNTLEQPNSLPITFDIDPWGQKTDFRIDLGDTSSILSKLQELCHQDPGIFDFWMTGMDFQIAVPRRYPIDVLGDASLCNWVFNGSESGLLNVKFTNNGPEGTALVGLGSGDDVKLGLLMIDPAADNYYRRLDATEDFGDIANRARVDALTKGHFARTIVPQHEITVEVYTEAVPDFWYGTIYPGCAVWIDYTNGIYHLNSAFEVVSIDLEVNTETDEMVTLNLNQVWPMYQEPAPPVVVAPGTDVNKPPVYVPPFTITNPDPVGGTPFRINTPIPE